MELKTMILGHFLVISLALNAGLLYRDYFNGKQKAKDVFSFADYFKNATLVTNRDSHVAKGTVLETKTPFSSSSTSSNTTSEALSEVIDLDHGDPTMYEKYWQKMGEKATVIIPGWKFISYFSDRSRLCWFLEPEFASAVKRLHKLVGNAATEDYYMVVGTGSSQLFQAVLYAVSSQLNSSEPISVVSAAPFYSSYPSIADMLKSGLYKWDGDASKFEGRKPYVEIVTYPNNPDGLSRGPAVNREKGMLVYDLAYYWPQYTPISSSPANHDIMLFTVSKSTGHAGSRLGWALVKDREIARRMTEYMVLSTIGVSKESQLRAAKILQVVSDTIEDEGGVSFFDHCYEKMAKRWKKLEEAVKESKLFSLPELPQGKCAFGERTFSTQPAFAWLKCEAEIEDCEGFLREHKIITRSGKHFGDSEKYVRISTLPRDEVFDQFVERLSSIKSL